MMKQTKMRFKNIMILLLFPAALNAQQDQAAITVLSDFSHKAKDAPSVSMEFRLITSDAKENTVDTLAGNILISGDRYKLTMPGNIIWSDGKTAWNYLEDANEVTITTNDPGEKSFIAKPSLLFTLYKEGYKVRLIEDAPKYWLIDLYPEKLDNNLIRIRLKIGKSLYNLMSAEYKSKDGVLITLISDKYNLSVKPDAASFNFDSVKYHSAEVNDMR
jgi:outer membrane lipoprotein carrier protein